MLSVLVHEERGTTDSRIELYRKVQMQPGCKDIIPADLKPCIVIISEEEGLWLGFKPLSLFCHVLALLQCHMCCLHVCSVHCWMFVAVILTGYFCLLWPHTKWFILCVFLEIYFTFNLFKIGTVHISEHWHVNMSDCSHRLILICSPSAGWCCTFYRNTLNHISHIAQQMKSITPWPIHELTYIHTYNKIESGY